MKTTTTLDSYDFGLHEKLEVRDGEVVFRKGTTRHKTTVEFLSIICESVAALELRTKVGKFEVDSVCFREPFSDSLQDVRTVRAKWIDDVIYIDAFFHDDYYPHVQLTTHIRNFGEKDTTKHWSSFSKFKEAVEQIETKLATNE